jgi:hypothetical protein
MRKLNLKLYDQTVCKKLCYQDYVIKICNCSNSKFPSLENKNKCDIEDELICLLKIDQSLNSNEIHYKDLCGFDCPMECDTIDYILSRLLFQRKYYFNLLASKSKLLNSIDYNEARNYIL